MIKFDMKKSEIIEMVKKMSIKVKFREDSFIFPIIALIVRPDGEIEWIGRFQNVTACIRVKCTISTDTSEPAQIPINAHHILSELIPFRNKDIISFIHDPDQSVYFLANKKDERSRTLRINASTKYEASYLLERFPYRLEKESGMILFENGLAKPTVSGSCDVKIFQDLVKNAIQNKKNELCDIKEKSLKKKVNDKPLMYNIYIDSEHHQIKTVAGTEHGKYSIVELSTNNNSNGSCELHYTSGFSEIVNILSGEIKFYAVDNGSLLLTQDTNRMRIRYFLDPTPEYAY